VLIGAVVERVASRERVRSSRRGGFVGEGGAVTGGGRGDVCGDDRRGRWCLRETAALFWRCECGCAGVGLMCGGRRKRVSVAVGENGGEIASDNAQYLTLRFSFGEMTVVQGNGL